ncbi:MAG: AAA family ATPase [Gammaproteobacteria bacterium]|nr:AAA family ATPase [Gammaproteobacteria bacterium]MDH5594222.1 AAA family ATPase [Gammaproteobacteria bacterium]
MKAKKTLGENKTEIARVIAVTSGRKGMGKTNIAVSFAIVLAELGNRVTLIDMDPGVAGVNMLMDIKPEYNIGNVINDGKPVQSAITHTAYRVDILPGISADNALVGLSETQKENLFKAADSLCHNNDYIIIDTKAGESKDSEIVMQAADEVIVITTTDPEAVMDAYATIKLIKQGSPDIIIHLVINRAESEKAAINTMRKVGSIVEQFIHGQLEDDGYLPTDNAVMKAEAHNKPFVVYDPASVATQALKGITNAIINKHTSPLTYVRGEKEGFFVRLKNRL